MAKSVRTTQETGTGRNVMFVDTKNNATMTRAQFVREIKTGNYPDYHVRTINDVKTPVSNPDKKTSNNLD